MKTYPCYLLIFFGFISLSLQFDELINPSSYKEPKAKEDTYKLLKCAS
jgi:hypothetical protein